jgi:membrane protease YdiL (CAAX protease family)
MEPVILQSILVAILLSIPLMAWWHRPVPPAPLNPLPPDTPSAEPSEPPPPPVPLESLPHHQWWQRKDAWLAIVLTIVLSHIMGPVASGSGPPRPIRLTPVMMQVQLVFQLGITALVIVFLKDYRRLPVRQLSGWLRTGLIATTGTALLWIVPAMLILGVFNLGLIKLLKSSGVSLDAQPITYALKDVSNPSLLALSAIVLAVGAPLMEEIVFRGVLYSNARRWFPKWYALAASSLFFAVVHANLLSFIPLAALGAIFAEVYDRTRNLAVPVIMHGFFNLSSFLMLVFAPDVPI